MADFPLSLAYVDTKSSGETWPDKRLISTSRGGTPRQRLLASAKGRGFRLAYIALPAADKTTTETFYDANRATTFNITWFGSTFLVMFADPDGLDWKPMEDSKWQITIAFLKA